MRLDADDAKNTGISDERYWSAILAMPSDDPGKMAALRIAVHALIKAGVGPYWNDQFGLERIIRHQLRLDLMASITEPKIERISYRDLLAGGTSREEGEG